MKNKTKKHARLAKSVLEIKRKGAAGDRTRFLTVNYYLPSPKFISFQKLMIFEIINVQL